MTMNWVRLGQQLRAARRTKDLKQLELANLAGVSLSTVQAIEGGKAFARVTPTVRTLARLVGWQDGSAETVLAGGDPTPAPATATHEPLPQEPPAEPESAYAHLPVRIREELKEGQFLDSGVYDISPEGSDVQMIVVIKGKTGATPEEIRRYMETVRRTERRLRQLNSPDESNTP
jgi:transcriptional regulator with XRE-family HTH domain